MPAAKNCVLKKNHYISHVKCDSFLLYMTVMMRSFDNYRHCTIQTFIEEQSR